MGRENFANFALTALVSPSPLTSGGTSFVVTTGQGALFPLTNFLVTIDAEILFISSRSTDTFTVGTRGYDGTTAASHTVGAAIQLSASAYNYTHIWQNVADTFTPYVPPTQLGGSASAWDNEFEGAGGWTLYPSSAGTGTTWNAGSTLRSMLLMDRGATDNAIYSAYIAFNPTASTAYLATLKLSLAASFLQSANTNCQDQCYFFIGDQTNPTASVTGGNRFYMRTILSTDVNTSGASFYAGPYNQPYAFQAHGAYTASGTSTTLTPAVIPAPGQTLYLRIAFDGANTYTAYIGDGVVYWPIASKSSLTFTPQTIGVQFANYVPSGSGYPGSHAVDYVRVVMGTGNGRFG